MTTDCASVRVRGSSEACLDSLGVDLLSRDWSRTLNLLPRLVRLHTVLVVALATLEVRRTVPRRPPDCLELVTVARRRTVHRCDARQGFGRRPVVDIDVDWLVVWMGGGRLGDGGGSLRHEELDDFPVLTELL